MAFKIGGSVKGSLVPSPSPSNPTEWREISGLLFSLPELILQMVQVLYSKVDVKFPVVLPKMRSIPKKQIL